MKIELSKYQIDMKEQFKNFTDNVISIYAKDNDLNESISQELIDKIIQEGYLGAIIPKEFDGMGLDIITAGLLNEEFGRGCSSAKSLLTVHGMVSIGILRWGNDKQKEEFLPKLSKGKLIGAFGLSEPDVGSDAKGIKTTAIEDGDFFVLNGTKKWITMGQIANVFIIFAICSDKPTAFIVDRETPGFSIKPMKGLMGARASMIAELSFEACKIPKENVLGGIGLGLSHICQTCLDYGRYTIAWGCVGLSQACLDASLKYARSRKQFGSYLRSNQLIQKMITEMVVDIKAARLLCFNAGYLKDIGDPDSIMETWNAKYFASVIANKVSDKAVQIHGANGCYNEYPVERYYRDARINEIIEGTTQMHEILIAVNTFRNM